MPRRNNTITHLRPIIINNCKTKRQFQNETEAKKAAEYQMLINLDLNLSVYQCEICHKWHLTRQIKK